VENRVHYRKTAVIVLWSLLTGPVGATYKCIEEGGRVFYQDAPCPAHAHGGELNQNVNRTFAGSAPPPAFNAPNAPCCATDSTLDTPLRKEDADNKQSVAPNPP